MTSALRIRLSNGYGLPLALCLFLAWPSLASTLVVYNNNDVGAGSLRQAIADNAALGGGNTIVFSNTVTGTITLASELDIGDDVTITGPGAKVLTVSGNNTSRVFNIVSGTVSISGLTIANGRLIYSGDEGAGIYLQTGALTVMSCTISNNNSSEGYGGGVYVTSGSFGMLDCRISGNLASSGGGIFYQDLAAYGTLYNCTVDGNTAAASGGGIYQAGGPLSLYSCTLTGNSATDGGGVYENTGTLTIRSCTISGNRAVSAGGVYQYFGSASVGDSVIASNSASIGPDCYGGFSSVGFNLIGAGDGSTGFNNNGDQVGTVNSPINPLLGPLQDNGGPTLTMALLPGSPAIDQGVTEAGITSDQRGQPRIFDFPNIPNGTEFGDGSDIGAFEYNPVAYPPDGTIVYCRHHLADDSTTVWFANPLLGYDLPVTAGWMARISLERRYLVFLRDSSNGSAYGSRGDLWVRDLVSGTETNLYHDTDYIVGADFTRDETRIMLDFGCADWSINRDGSSLGVLTSLSGGSCYDDAPAVNPVDGRMVYHNNGAGGGIALADSNFQNKALVPNAALGTYALWSHDGQWISYTLTSAYYTYLGYNLYKIKPDGSGRTQLTRLSGGSDQFAYGAAWTSDGQSLIGAATVGGKNGLYRVTADGSGTPSFVNITQAGDPVAYVGSILGTPFPRLSMSRTPPYLVVVSWPSPSPGWVLQQSTDLAGTTWTTPAEPVHDSGLAKFINIVLPTGTRAFRLVLP